MDLHNQYSPSSMNPGMVLSKELLESSVRRNGFGFVGAGATAAMAAVGGSTGASAGGIMTASAAGGPVGMAIGAAITGVMMGLQLLFNRKGPKQKVATTKIVDDAAVFLQQNLDAYFSSPERTEENRQQAIAVYHYAWDEVKRLCSDPAMGNPGKACIKDRERGGRWPWPEYYLDPIVNDTVPQENALKAEQAAKDLLPSILSGDGAGNSSDWLLYAGIGVIILYALTSK